MRMPYQLGSHGQSIMNPTGGRARGTPLSTATNSFHCPAVIDRTPARSESFREGQRHGMALQPILGHELVGVTKRSAQHPRGIEEADLGPHTGDAVASVGRAGPAVGGHLLLVIAGDAEIEGLAGGIAHTP